MVKGQKKLLGIVAVPPAGDATTSTRGDILAGNTRDVVDGTDASFSCSRCVGGF